MMHLETAKGKKLSRAALLMHTAVKNGTSDADEKKKIADEAHDHFTATVLAKEAKDGGIARNIRGMASSDPSNSNNAGQVTRPASPAENLGAAHASAAHSIVVSQANPDRASIPQSDETVAAQSEHNMAATTIEQPTTQQPMDAVTTSGAEVDALKRRVVELEGQLASSLSDNKKLKKDNNRLQNTDSERKKQLDKAHSKNY